MLHFLLKLNYNLYEKYVNMKNTESWNIFNYKGPIRITEWINKYEKGRNYLSLLSRHAFEEDEKIRMHYYRMSCRLYKVFYLGTAE